MSDKVQVSFTCLTTKEHVLHLPDADVPAWFTERSLNIEIARNSGLVSDILLPQTEVQQGKAQFSLRNTILLKLVHDAASGNTTLVWISPGPIAQSKKMSTYANLDVIWGFAEPIPPQFTAVRSDATWGFVDTLCINEEMLSDLENRIPSQQSALESTVGSFDTCNPSDTWLGSSASV